MRKIVKSLHL
jgi:hypothetical protein